MPRPKLKVTKHSFRLFEGDNQRLLSYYGASGVNNAVRAIIHRHLNHLDHLAAQRREASAPAAPVDLSTIPIGDISDLINDLHEEPADEQTDTSHT